LDIAGHTLNDVWSDGQGLDTRVPRLLGDSVRQCLVFQIFVSIHPLLKLNDLQWISGSGQNLGKEWIGIQRNRRYE
jgi:hypothetical protein